VTRAVGSSRFALWWHGARPRTLPASVAPVVVGTAAAGHAELWRFVAALLVGLGLQVGVNYANDYHDGVRGIDTGARLGPPRLVASGMASARAVLVAALVCIAVAAAAGLALAIATTLWLIPLGAIAMLALWLYTGGPRPYAGLGLGELMVFLFFGVMATAGTAYVQAERVTSAAWWSSAAMGFLAVAILVANNLRDIPTDAAAGRRTLAVRLGDRRTRLLYRACVAGSFATVALGVVANIALDGAGLPQWALFALAAWPLALRPFEVVGSAQGRELIPALVSTAQLQLAFGGLLALGLWIAGATAS
jgi:1,4-dihydroxy-2-naphthoate polyprenyltransferase